MTLKRIPSSSLIDWDKLALFPTFPLTWTKFLRDDWTRQIVAWAWDMLASIYDPTNKAADAFSMDNMVETATKKILTAAERTILWNTSWTNSGDQDLSALALKSNVLELNNTTPFTPDADYEPATKKYVDDNSWWSGDMLKSTYDPTNVNWDAFDMDNMVEWDTNLLVNSTEKSTWNGKQDALWYTAENAANKKTTLTDNSDTYYPTQKAVKTAVDAKQDTMTKATWSDVDTGTDDTKYLTAKAMKDSAYLSSMSDVDAASDTVAGKVELATAAETSTGTDATRAVTPDWLAGSNIFGRKGFTVIAVDSTTDVSVADGKAYVAIPECMNWMNLVRANAVVNTAGTTNATTIDIYNITDSHDMLSTAISIASGWTVGTAWTVDASYDDVATNDVLRIDVTSASTTKPKWLIVVLEFQLP